MNNLHIIANALGFTPDNNDIDKYQNILNNNRTVIYNSIINKFNELTTNFKHSSVNYMVYFILSVLTKPTSNDNSYIPDLDYYRETNINTSILMLINQNIINYLTSGNIKLILNHLIYSSNMNADYKDIITNILNILDNNQLFIIMSITDEQRNYIMLNLRFHSIKLYNIEDNEGNDFMYKHYNFINTEDIQKEINYLESQYTQQNKMNYFILTINKLFNGNYGIIHLRNNLNLNYYQLSYCLYYMSHKKFTIDERFHKFVKVLSYEQINYIGV